jgi:hypothetical protein
MVEVWHIACRDGVPLENLHAALSAIPEYNELLAEDFKILEPNAGAVAPPPQMPDSTNDALGGCPPASCYRSSELPMNSNPTNE